MLVSSVLHGALCHMNPQLSPVRDRGNWPTEGDVPLCLLGVIVLSSVKSIRRLCYELFYTIQCVASFLFYHANLYLIHSILPFIAFFFTICYDTVYVSPWIFSPVAFYGLYSFMRMLRLHLKDAVFVPIENQVTLVSR